jgi:signal transduction histidine kinase
MRRLLPRSLRSRLILSFGLLIFITIFLAGLTTVYLVKTEQEKAARQRYELLSLSVSARSAILEAANLPPEEIQRVLEREYDVRILLLDGDAKVIEDSDETLVNSRIEELEQQGLRAGSLNDVRSQPMVRRYTSGPEDLLLFLSAQGPVVAFPGANALAVPKYQPLIAVPESDVKTAWKDLLPRLVIAGSVAFMASVFTAGIIARSITRPLRRITLASEEMARGRYDQTIPEYGGEEVGRLASAFNDMAHQVNHSYGTLRDFLANVSHELKTPLTSIQGFSQAMVDGSLKNERDYAEAGRIINDESVRMRGLVDDLLYLSQVDAGQVQFRFETIDPRELLSAADERFRRRATQAGVELSVVSTEVPPIQADGRRLEQAIANIVDNALRYTPRGGRITLASTAENGHVDLSVHNTGSVIPDAAMPHLFERFFQVDPAKARADGNTGLGLAITKEIVEAHRGSIDVKSSAGAGTEFVISVPSFRRPIFDEEPYEDDGS